MLRPLLLLLTTLALFPARAATPRLNTTQEALVRVIKAEIRLQCLKLHQKKDLTEKQLAQANDLAMTLAENEPFKIPPDLLATFWPYQTETTATTEPPGGESAFPARVPDLQGLTLDRFVVQFTRYLGALGVMEGPAPIPYLEASQGTPKDGVAVGDELARWCGGKAAQWRKGAGLALPGIQALVRRAVPLLAYLLKTEAAKYTPPPAGTPDAQLAKMKTLANLAASLDKNRDLGEKAWLMHDFLDPWAKQVAAGRQAP